MKPKRQRSRAYPAFALGECIQWASTVRSELGCTALSRSAIAWALGFKGLNGASARRIAAMSYFGLFERDNKGLKLSALSDRILKPLSDEEKRKAVVQAFLAPVLYAELMARFKLDGRIPTLLPNILARDYGILDAAARDAAEAFLASGRFAEVISAEGQIGQREPQAALGEGEAEPPPAQDAFLPAEAGKGLRHEHDGAGGEQDFRLALTRGRYAHFRVPADLSMVDIQLIRTQVEVWALQATLAEHAGGGSEDARPEEV